MARSQIYTFVASARAVLSAQLIVSVAAVALAGWTLAVTSELIRERNRLQERVIQLEEIMAARGDVPPPVAVVASPTPQSDDYPASVNNAAPLSAFDASSAATAEAMNAEPAQLSHASEQRDLGAIVSGLFGPAPPVRVVVLHTRSAADAARAADIARRQADETGPQFLINVLPERDARQSGYAYFDGRQSRSAANIVARFLDGAREQQIAPWSAQLRGMALPANGEYSEDRLDITLPALPLPPPPVEVITAPAQTPAPR